MTSSDEPVEPPPPPREDTQPIPVMPSTGDPAGPGGAGGAGGPGGAGAPVPVRRSRGAVLAVAALIAVIAVLGIAVVANATVARNAEAEASAQAELALGSPADVRLSRFPVGLRLLTGAPVDATLVARDVPLEGSEARLTRLEVDATDVVLERGGDGAVRAERATFLAELDDDGVQQLIPLIGRIPLTDIELANGVARLSVAGFAVLDATADVEAGQVVLRLASPLGSLDFLGNLSRVPLQLGELPLGFAITDVEIRRDVLRLRGTTVDLRLEGT